MLYYAFATIVISLLLIALASFSSRGSLLLNPMAYYALFQLIGFVGTTAAIDFNEPYDVLYYYICACGIVFSAIGFALANLSFPLPKELIATWKQRPFLIESGTAYKTFLTLMALFSALVCVAYFASIGYNVFLLGLSNLLENGTSLTNVSELRLASYDTSGSGQYHFPGYVNQFKDTIFPLTLFYLWTLYFSEPNRAGRLFTFSLLLGLTVASLIAILGTGQRGAFVLAMVMGGSFLTVVLPSSRKFVLFFLSVGIALPLFAISTQINGRAESKEFDLSSVLFAIWQRLASDNQWGAVLGFRMLICDLPIQWGAEWWESILGISPWHGGSSLSSDVARIVWRGGSGTIPPSNWGSIYHNFSWFGVVVIPLVTCTLFGAIQQRFYTGPKTVFRTMVYVYCYIFVGSWIAGSPFEHLLNVGLVAVVGLRIICRRLESAFGTVYVQQTAIPN